MNLSDYLQCQHAQKLYMLQVQQVCVITLVNVIFIYSIVNQRSDRIYLRKGVIQVCFNILRTYIVLRSHFLKTSVAIFRIGVYVSPYMRTYFIFCTARLIFEPGFTVVQLQLIDYGLFCVGQYFHRA